MTPMVASWARIGKKQSETLARVPVPAGSPMRTLEPS